MNPLAALRGWFTPAAAGKWDNRDGTTSERWICGCKYTSDTATGRILAEHPCPRHGFKRRAGGQQAPGSGQAPAPGPGPANPPAGRQQDTPLLPPAPAPHGGKIKIVELWADGRIRTYDPRTGDTRIRPGFCPDCAEGGDWDAALRDLRRGTS